MRLQLVFELDKEHLLESMTEQEFEELEKDLESTHPEILADDYRVDGFRLARVRYKSRKVIL